MYHESIIKDEVGKIFIHQKNYNLLDIPGLFDSCINKH